MKGNPKINVTITQGYGESTYLIDSNKKKFEEIVVKKEWSHGDMLDMLLSLHIVLEAGFNCIFRRITLFKFKKDISEIKIMKNIDNVSFRDKLTLFIYNSTFDFGDKLQEATRHHEIISLLKQFTEVRNQIMHGHAIGTVHINNESVYTDLRKKILTDRILMEQISKYLSVVDGFNFYFMCLSDESIKSSMSQYIKYIDYDFIPQDLIEKARRINH